jgi:ATP-dependent protease ClpP protease subunit
LDQITAPEILVRINSIGGSVFAGIAIYNAIRQHPAHVTTQVDAMAASIASVIAQAGDRRVMMQHSQMMIHEAAGIAIGSAQDMREYADILERQTDLIADIYTARAGDVGNKATFRKMMSAETWLSDDEAVDIGLADEVVTPSAKSATVTEDKSTADHAENKIDYSSLFTQTIEETLEEIYR